MITDTLKITAFSAVFLAVGAQAQVIDSWTFENGTGIDTTLSNNGTALADAASSMSTVTTTGGGFLNFTSTDNNAGANESAFRNISTDADWGSTPLSSGILEISYTVSSSSFANTDAVTDASANVGFGIRYNDGSNKDISSRLRFESGADGVAGNFVLQSKTDINGSWTDNEVNLAAGNSLADISFRTLIDFDNDVANFYYTIGGGSETLYESASIAAGAQAENFRTAVQASNGGTNWQIGDITSLSSLQISVVPEPSTYAMLAGVCALTSVMLRRRRA